MNQTRKLFTNKYITKTMLYGHIAATILSLILFFTGTSDLFAVLGSHVVVFPILGLAVAAAMESIVLVGICSIYWGIGMTALAIGWYSAIKHANYRTLLIVCVADVVFSLIIMILSICVGQFTSFHILMILGVILGAVYSVYLFFLDWFTKLNEEDAKKT